MVSPGGEYEITLSARMELCLKHRAAWSDPVCLCKPRGFCEVMGNGRYRCALPCDDARAMRLPRDEGYYMTLQADGLISWRRELDPNGESSRDEYLFDQPLYSCAAPETCRLLLGNDGVLRAFHGSETRWELDFKGDGPSVLDGNAAEPREAGLHKMLETEQSLEVGWYMQSVQRLLAGGDAKGDWRGGASVEIDRRGNLCSLVGGRVAGCYCGGDRRLSRIPYARRPT